MSERWPAGEPDEELHRTLADGFNEVAADDQTGEVKSGSHPDQPGVYPQSQDQGSQGLVSMGNLQEPRHSGYEDGRRVETVQLPPITDDESEPEQ